jgi:Holliday junction resolvasome RuvABC DNA-binding subunit
MKVCELISALEYLEFIFKNNEVAKNRHNWNEFKQTAYNGLKQLGFTAEEITEWENSSRLYRTGEKEIPEKVKKLINREFDFKFC